LAAHQLCNSLAVAAIAAVSLFPTSVWAQEEKAAAAETRPIDEEKTDAYLSRLIVALGEDESYKVRLQAAVFLGRSDDERAFEPLISALNSDENYPVRAAAAIALANLNDPRAISHIIKRIATDPEPFVVEEATRGLAKYEREVALPYVVATYGSDSQEIRLEAVRYLAREPDDDANGVLIRALGDDQKVFELVKDAALKMDQESALEMLQAALDHREAAVRRGAVLILRALATPAAAKLIRDVYERDIEADGVRNETRAALRELRRFLEVDNIVRDAVSNPHKHGRAKALKLLGVVGGDKAEQVLLDALKDEDVYLRGTAVMAMAELGNARLVPALEKLEADPANQRILHLVRHTLKQLSRKETN